MGSRGKQGYRETSPTNDGCGCFEAMIKVGRAIFRVIRSTVGLLCLLLGYTMLGGWMFSKIEGPSEELAALNMSKIREEFLTNILEASKSDNYVEQSKLLLKKYEAEMHEFFLRGRIPEKSQTWTLLGGVIYCMTVYTTIGYGHIAPLTSGGRIATVFYAIIGIPLCLMVLADLGRLLTRLIKAVLTVIRLYYYRGHLRRLRKTKALKAIEETLDMQDNVDTEDLESEVAAEFNFPVSIAVVILLTYLLGCAAIFPEYEDWTYAQSVYFLFISVSTIGFGDMVPNPENQTWLLLSTIIVFIGLSLVSMIVNVLIIFISDLYTKATTQVAETVNQVTEAIGIDLRMGDSSSDQTVVNRYTEKSGKGKTPVSGQQKSKVSGERKEEASPNTNEQNAKQNKHTQCIQTRSIQIQVNLTHKPDPKTKV